MTSPLTSSGLKLDLAKLDLADEKQLFDELKAASANGGDTWIAVDIIVELRRRKFRSHEIARQVGMFPRTVLNYARVGQAAPPLTRRWNSSVSTYRAAIESHHAEGWEWVMEQASLIHNPPRRKEVETVITIGGAGSGPVGLADKVVKVIAESYSQAALSEQQWTDALILTKTRIDQWLGLPYKQRTLADIVKVTVQPPTTEGTVTVGELAPIEQVAEPVPGEVEPEVEPVVVEVGVTSYDRKARYI